MKKARKILLPLIMVLVLVAIAFATASCDKSYTIEESDAMIAELNEAIKANKAEYDAKIASLEADCKAKNDALAAEIAANKLSLTELKAKYDADLALLNKADADNKNQIENLATDYNNKVAELEAADALTDKALADLTAKYEEDLKALNKADEENKALIENLTSEYNKKVEELEAADALTDKALADLTSKYEEDLKSLNKADEDNKTQIENLTSEYNNKVEELEAADALTDKALADLTAKYEADLELLNKADENITKEISNLKAVYDAKIELINADILVIESKIEANKKELESSITSLENTYNERVLEINNLITEIQNTDSTQNDRISELESKFNEIISNHKHTFGEWIKYSNESTSCEDSLFYRICITCSVLEWKQGSDCDHKWGTECYYYDDAKHWVKCNECYSVQDNGEHQSNSKGVCTVCGCVVEKVSPATDFEWYVSGGKVIITKCHSAETEIVIPALIDGKLVAGFDSSAFSFCTSLTSIVIPDSVTSIGSGAFYECTSLTSIVIPDSVTSIGSYAFYYCTSLTSITIPDSVTEIGSSAFEYCTKLVEVINKSYLNITAGSADYGCVGYYAIEVHNGASKIVNYNDYLFYTYNGVNYLHGYTGNDTELILPENYNGENYEIYDYAFRNCTSLTSVVIPDSVTSIGYRAFYYCTSLTSVTIGNSVTSIGNYAFSGCKSLTSVVIPDSVTSIGDDAFAYCYNLTSIVIPDSVTSIGSDAFYYCTSLTSIVIPNSVTSIGSFAFYYCNSLTIYCEAASKPSGWDDSWNNLDFSDYYSNCPVVWGYNENETPEIPEESDGDGNGYNGGGTSGAIVLENIVGTYNAGSNVLVINEDGTMTYTAGSNVSNYTITINGSTISYSLNGSATYTPPAGMSQYFGYIIFDENGMPASWMHNAKETALTLVGGGSEGGDEGGEDIGGGDEDITAEEQLNIGPNYINFANINFVYTAPVNGTLKLEIGTAMMGMVSVTYTVNGGEPQILELESYVEFALNAGDVVYVYVEAEGAATLGAIWTESEVVSNDKELALDNNQIEQADVNFHYTATEAGKLTLTAGGAIMGMVEITYTVNNGEAQILELASTVVLDLVAGDKVVVIVKAEGYSSITASFAKNAPVADGSSKNPFVIESLPYSVTYEGDHEFYYTFTADKDMTLVIHYSEGGLVSDLPEGWTKDTATLTYAVPLTSGQTMKIYLWTMRAAGTFIYTFEEAVAAEPETPDEPETPGEPTGVLVYISETASNGRKVKVEIDVANGTMVVTRSNSSGSFEGTVGTNYTYSYDPATKKVTYTTEETTGFLNLIFDENGAPVSATYGLNYINYTLQ